MESPSSSPSPSLHPPSPEPIPRYKLKRTLTYITMGMFFLSGGIEYSVILPTCWDFMRLRFHSEKWLYGLTLSAMSMTNLFVGPVMGAIYDHTHQTKIIVVILLLFQIGGNFMYFAATSKYMVLGSRFIVGLGVTGGAVLFGELARVTTKRSRTGVFSLFMSTRQVGLVVGPAFNLFLRECHFTLGPFTVDKYTAPALFMAIVFSVIAVMVIVMFFHLPTALGEESPVVATTGNPIIVEIREGGRFIYPSTTPSETSSLLSPAPQSEVDTPTSDEEEVTVPTYGTIQSSSALPTSIATPTLTSDHSPFLSGVLRMFNLTLSLLREETVVLLVIILFAMMSQMVLETGAVPFAEGQLKWAELETSIFYSIAGAQIIVVFLISTLLSKVVTDRWLMVIGLGFELAAYMWYNGTLGSGKKSSWILEQFIIGTLLVLSGLPILLVASTSLYSKMLPSTMQGFGQGVRRSMTAMAGVLGPLWAGSSFELEEQYGYYPFFGVSLVLLLIAAILLLLSFRKLKEPNYKQLKMAS